MNMRPWHTLAAAGVIVGLAAGCASSSNTSSPGSSSSGSSSPSSAPSPTGSDLATDRDVYSGPLIVQCALTSGLMKPPTGMVTPAGQTPWLNGTKLAITPANVGTFNNWYASIVGTTIAGKEIEVWAQQTASTGKLPPAVCGTSVTASQLQKQIFAKDPAAGDPW